MADVIEQQFKPNDRVALIGFLHESARRLYFLGYGVYVHNETPPEERAGILGIFDTEISTDVFVEDNTGDIIYGTDIALALPEWFGKLYIQYLLDHDYEVIQIGVDDLLAMSP